MLRFLLLLAIIAGPAQAEGERPGEFDYYVLSLSWSPTFCALIGDERENPQCDTGKEFGWVLHGLWPQYETGWPSYCPTKARNPSRADTRAEADIYGSSGSAWHQWNKHGRCTGLKSAEFYDLAREAYASVTRPLLLRQLDQSIRLPAKVIETAFLESNPNLSADQITITCKSGYIQEARICLTRSLEPRTCGQDVIRDCTMDNAQFDPIR